MGEYNLVFYGSYKFLYSIHHKTPIYAPMISPITTFFPWENQRNLRLETAERKRSSTSHKWRDDFSTLPRSRENTCVYYIYIYV